jgi:hypothetical protein
MSKPKWWTTGYEMITPERLEHMITDLRKLIGKE